jgi:hypothetical protein
VFSEILIFDNELLKDILLTNPVLIPRFNKGNRFNNVINKVHLAKSSLSRYLLAKNVKI